MKNFTCYLIRRDAIVMALGYLGMLAFRVMF